jgi:hypothetical protein
LHLWNLDGEFWAVGQTAADRGWACSHRGHDATARVYQPFMESVQERHGRGGGRGGGERSQFPRLLHTLSPLSLSSTTLHSVPLSSSSVHGTLTSVCCCSCACGACACARVGCVYVCVQAEAEAEVRARPRSPDRRVEVLKGQLREAQLTVARCEAKCAASASTTTTLRVELEKLRNQRELEQHTRQIEAEVCVFVCGNFLFHPINNIFLTPAEWCIARGV